MSSQSDSSPAPSACNLWLSNAWASVTAAMRERKNVVAIGVPIKTPVSTSAAATEATAVVFDSVRPRRRRANERGGVKSAD